tara:strand:- start:279 stop:482 length:204 start_codon:yes stop_codon:yes gene_type:complete
MVLPYESVFNLKLSVASKIQPEHNMLRAVAVIATAFGEGADLTSFISGVSFLIFCSLIRQETTAGAK